MQISCLLVRVRTLWRDCRAFLIHSARGWVIYRTSAVETALCLLDKHTKIYTSFIDDMCVCACECVCMCVCVILCVCVCVCMWLYACACVLLADACIENVYVQARRLSLSLYLSVSLSVFHSLAHSTSSSLSHSFFFLSHHFSRTKTCTHVRALALPLFLLACMYAYVT